MSLIRHRVCFFPPTSKGRMGGFATAGSMHADRVKTLLLFGGSFQCAQKDGDSDSHKIDYTRVGFETRSFFPCVRAGLPEDIVYHVNSGITVADIAASSTAEPRSAGSRRHCTVWEVHCTLAGVDRVIRVNITAQL